MSGRGRRGDSRAAAGATEEPALDRLFTTPPDRFVAVRDELAREARAAGREDLAIRLKALRRPNAVTWLANALARRHRDAVERVLDEGRALREAYANGDRDAIRETTGRRRRALADAIRLGRGMGGEGGGRLDERRLADILLAASLDEAAAKRLLGGRLDREIELPAFEGLGGAPAEPRKREAPARTETAARRDTAKERARAAAEKARRRALAREAATAERAAARAEAAAERLEEKAARARERAERARARADEARSVAAERRSRLEAVEASGPKSG
jgi:hypothetical protein